MNEFAELTSNPRSPNKEPPAQPTIHAGREAVQRVTLDEQGNFQETGGGGTARLTAEQQRVEAAGNGTSIVSTARDHALGLPISGDRITPQTIMLYEGREITAQIAETIGLIKRVDGQYVDVSPAEREQAINGTPKTEETDAGEAFSPNDEAALTALATALPADVHHEIIAKVVSGKELPVELLHDWGVSIGQTPEVFQQNLNNVMSAFHTQADNAVKSLGLTDADVPAFYEWAKENHREALQSAMHEQAYSRSTKGYKELANKYLRATPPSEDAMRQGGHELTRDGSGKITLVTINGVQMSVETAARLGLV